MRIGRTFALVAVVALLGACADRIDPAEARDAAALQALGALEQRQGHTDLAEGWFREALDVDPNLEGALRGLASIRAAAGATQEAIGLYRRLVMVAPADAKAHYDLGVLLRRSGLREEAIAQIQQAVALDPSLVLGSGTPSP